MAAGPNLEARARAARFAVLPDDVATGHTMDDQAETILVNLLRGAGADGLAGMEPGPRHPILGLRRHETHALCAAAGLAPVCDESNDDPAFVRNRIRHELLPLCAQVAGRDPVPLLARQAGVLRSEVALLDALADELLPDPTDAKAVTAAPRPLARRALRRWLREAGDGEHPPSLAEVDRTLAVAAGAAVGTELTGGQRVRRTRGRLRVEPGHRPGNVTPVTHDESGAGVPSWAAADVGPVLVDAERLAARVAELGADITEDYAGDPPLLVAVLKGAMLFMSDLCRAIALPVDVDFMAVSSYGSATRTSGVVRIVKDLDSELEGRHVLVVEDIIDSGLTLNYLRRYLNGAPAEERGDLCPAGQGGRAAGRSRPALHRLHHPARVRGGLRPRRGRALPQPAGGPPLQGSRNVSVDVERVRAAVSEILIAIGEDPERDGLLATPERVASMYEELFSGLHDDPARHLEVTFAAEHDEMVMVRDIPFASLCEHHLVPFLGKAHVAYIPAEDGRITGLSKLARLVDGFARRLQVQERMTTQIADAIATVLPPRGVLVVIEAEHLCMSMRGVKKPGTVTVTSSVRGLFRSDVATRAEAMQFIRGH